MTRCNWHLVPNRSGRDPPWLQTVPDADRLWPYSVFYLALTVPSRHCQHHPAAGVNTFRIRTTKWATCWQWCNILWKCIQKICKRLGYPPALLMCLLLSREWHSGKVTLHHQVHCHQKTVFCGKSGVSLQYNIEGQSTSTALANGICTYRFG